MEKRVKGEKKLNVKEKKKESLLEPHLSLRICDMNTVLSCDSAYEIVLVDSHLATDKVQVIFHGIYSPHEASLLLTLLLCPTGHLPVQHVMHVPSSLPLFKVPLRMLSRLLANPIRVLTNTHPLIMAQIMSDLLPSA